MVKHKSFLCKLNFYLSHVVNAKTFSISTVLQDFVKYPLSLNFNPPISKVSH